MVMEVHTSDNLQTIKPNNVKPNLKQENYETRKQKMENVHGQTLRFWRGSRNRWGNV